MKQETHIRVVKTKRGKKPVRVNPGFHKTKPQKLRNGLKEALKQAGPLNTPENKKTLITLKNRAKMNEEWTKLLIAALRMPVIAFKGQEDAYPKPIKDKVTISRLMQLSESPEDFKENATDIETLGFLSTMSLVAPLDKDAYEVMTYLFTKVNKGQVPKDLQNNKELSLTAKQTYDRLRKEIRKSQWEALKSSTSNKQ